MYIHTLRRTVEGRYMGGTSDGVDDMLGPRKRFEARDHYLVKHDGLGHFVSGRNNLWKAAGRPR